MFRNPGQLIIRMMGEKSASLGRARERLHFGALIFLVLFGFVWIRVFDLMILQGEIVARTLPEEIADISMPDGGESAPVRRGNIYDRNGVLLATSLETASLYADPKVVLDPQGTARDLCKIFPDLAYGDLLQKLQSNRRFIWIRRNLTPIEQAAVLEIGDPGLAFRDEPRRIYPQGTLGAHIVGFTDIDGTGVAGIEKSFEPFLAERGEDLSLTLDARIQHIVRRELDRTIREFSAKGGAAIVMDVTGGDIVAAVSLPDFDPNDPGAAPARARFNGMTVGVYELGSMFKIFSTAALFELANGRMSQKFDATRPLERAGHTIHDYHAEKRVLTVPEVFMYSSNIGAALMGEAVGSERLQHFYADLGLLSRPDLEIPEVGTPIVPDPWREITTLTASFGHGISVSPMQLMTAVARVVGEGHAVRPTLILDHARTPEERERVDVRVVSPETVHRIRQLMRLAVTDGTGKHADVPGFRVGGKTGTAEKAVNGRYKHDSLISSFVGVFPMNAPRYAVLVVVDEPKGNAASHGYATGGWVGAPAAGRIIAASAPILGVAPMPRRIHNPDRGDDLSNALRRYISYAGEEGEHIVR